MRLLLSWRVRPLLMAMVAAAAVSAETPKPDERRDTALKRSFASWKSACDKLPSNRSLKLAWPKREILPLGRFAEFDEVLNAFFAQCKTGSLAQATNWVGPL